MLRYPVQGATFACINAAAAPEDTGGKGNEGTGGEQDKEGKEQVRLRTFAFRVRAPNRVEDFLAAVDAAKAGVGQVGHGVELFRDNFLVKQIDAQRM